MDFREQEGRQNPQRPYFVQENTKNYGHQEIAQPVELKKKSVSYNKKMKMEKKYSSSSPSPKKTRSTFNSSFDSVSPTKSSLGLVKNFSGKDTSAEKINQENNYCDNESNPFAMMPRVQKDEKNPTENLVMMNKMKQDEDKFMSNKFTHQLGVLPIEEEEKKSGEDSEESYDC